MRGKAASVGVVAVAKMSKQGAALVEGHTVWSGNHPVTRLSMMANTRGTLRPRKERLAEWIAVQAETDRLEQIEWTLAKKGKGKRRISMKPLKKFFKGSKKERPRSSGRLGSGLGYPKPRGLSEADDCEEEVYEGMAGIDLGIEESRDRDQPWLTSSDDDDDEAPVAADILHGGQPALRSSLPSSYRSTSPTAPSVATRPSSAPALADAPSLVARSPPTTRWSAPSSPRDRAPHGSPPRGRRVAKVAPPKPPPPPKPKQEAGAVEVVDAPVAAAEVTTPPAPRWVATHDAASGCDHWFDLSTFVTVHEKPEGFDSTPAAQWIAKADPSGSGHYYYEHRGTGETSWEPPPLRGDDNEAEGAAAAAAQRWYYADDTDDAAQRHGPFSLTQLKAWRDEGHFSNDKPVWCGAEDGVDDATRTPIELVEALRSAGIDDAEWWYEDAHDHAVLHGPFSPAQLKTWRDEGHFEDTMLVRCGREGAPVALGTVVA